jgi:hypothetical protein
MNLLLEIVVENGLLLDSAGILGIGLVALAAAKLSRRDQSWGGTLMALGAISLLLARLYFLLRPQFMTDDFLIAIGPLGVAALYALPPVLLTFGLGGVVGGLWSHERWLKEERRIGLGS